jgi:hypothetical protein
MINNEIREQKERRKKQEEEEKRQKEAEEAERRREELEREQLRQAKADSSFESLISQAYDNLNKGDSLTACSLLCESNEIETIKKPDYKYYYNLALCEFYNPRYDSLSLTLSTRYLSKAIEMGCSNCSNGDLAKDILAESGNRYWEKGNYSDAYYDYSKASSIGLQNLIIDKRMKLIDRRRRVGKVSAWLAPILGSGYYIYGEPKKGIIVGFVDILTVGGAIAGFYLEKQAYDSYMDAETPEEAEAEWGKVTAYHALGIGCCIGFVIESLYSYIDVKTNYNKIKSEPEHSYDFVLKYNIDEVSITLKYEF